MIGASIKIIAEVERESVSAESVCCLERLGYLRFNNMIVFFLFGSCQSLRIIEDS